MYENVPILYKTNTEEMAISKYVAFALCNTIREQSYRNISMANRCKRCMTTAIEGIPRQMLDKPGLRGCEHVNRALSRWVKE